MTALKFFKYQGTGHDFVMIDNRDESFDSDNNALIGRLCDRRFGIGADGLILIQNHAEFDFEMIYINPDGTRSLCGNGSRCAVRFAHDLGIIGNKTRFLTIEGPLHASLQDDLIHLSMPDVYDVSESRSNDFFIDTGSPHFVRFVEDVKGMDVYTTGKEIRETDSLYH